MLLSVGLAVGALTLPVLPAVAPVVERIGLAPIAAMANPPCGPSNDGEVINVGGNEFQCGNISGVWGWWPIYAGSSCNQVHASDEHDPPGGC